MEEIKEGIEVSLISIISSETGSGKTIGIPHTLMEDYRVFCALPTIAATKSSAAFLRSITGSESIGTACQGNIRYTSCDKVVYCTHGHLARKMIRTIASLLNRTSEEWFTDMIIVDEFHLQTVDITIIINLWRYYYHLFSADLGARQSDESPRLPEPPKLIISSATMPTLEWTETFQPYLFDGSSMTDVVSSHNVTKIFHPTHHPVRANERYLLAANLAIEHHPTEPDGVFLIFAPGKYEIEIITTALKSFSWPIHVLHSEIEFDLRSIKHQNRSIVVATNVAESSITIPDVVLVIDTGTHKVAHYDDNESCQLRLQLIPKSSSHQRAGRTGRTCPGKYIYLGSSDQYHALPDSTPPEITRQPIYAYLAKMIQYSIDPLQVFGEYKSLMEKQIRELVRQKYLVSRGNLSYRLTPLGSFAIDFPFNLRLNRAVYHLESMPMSRADRDFCLLILASIENYGHGIIQKQSPLLPKSSSETSVDHLITLWRQLMNLTMKRNALQEFCKKNLIDYRNVRETLTLYYRAVSVSHGDHEDHQDRQSLISTNTDISDILGQVFQLTHQDLMGDFVRERVLGIAVMDHLYRFSPAALVGNLDHDHQYIVLASHNNQITVYHRIAAPKRVVKSLYD